jgi:hypothetical protein
MHPLHTLRAKLILACLFAAHAVPTAYAVPFYVRARTTATADGFGVPNPYSATSDTGEVALTSVSASDLGGSVNSLFYNASGSSKAMAEIGSLHASASFGASSNSDGPFVGANGFGQAWWGDTLTITSDTLAPGTPVMFQATIDFHRVITGSGLGVVNALVSGPFGLSISDSRATPNAQQSATTVVHTTVGSQINIFSTLSVGASGSVGPGQGASGSVDAFNTSTFTFMPITPGASYSTASGVLFVPEPSTYGLCAMALIGLLACRRGTIGRARWRSANR